ncbi:energy transducer TonB [Sphingomonas sp.]|uniref:energy transducer TonB n=1 Tax=Sphingomonas sp. TaxID=28214 RepID=UPI003CC6D2A7
MTGLVATIAAAALQIATPSPAVSMLEPNGPWVIEGSEGACILTRSYGPDAAKITVGVQPLFNTPRAEIVVLTRDGSTWSGSGDGSVRFGADLIEGTFSSYPLDGHRRLTRFALPATVLDQIRAASTMTLTARGLSVAIRLVRTQAAFAGFEGCQRLLFRSWHVDPAQLAPDRTPMSINVENVFRPDDYPEDAQRQSIQGRVITVLDIGTDGAVTGCRVVSAVVPSLDRVTCLRARHARFTPGKDAAGRPEPSIYVLPVRWVLPYD